MLGKAPQNQPRDPTVTHQFEKPEQGMKLNCISEGSYVSGRWVIVICREFERICDTHGEGEESDETSECKWPRKEEKRAHLQREKMCKARSACLRGVPE